MPYQKWLKSSQRKDPKALLVIWREERGQRIAQTVCFGGIFLSLIATVADFFWSSVWVFGTDLVLLAGCLLSLYWLKTKKTIPYYWMPAYVGLWVSILPSLWSTGGLSSPFLGVDLAALYTFGAVMDTRRSSTLYFVFALLHIPAFYFLSSIYSLSLTTLPPLSLTAVVTGVTFAAVYLFVHSILRTEHELSFEFARSFRRVAHAEEELKKSETLLLEAQSVGQIGSWEWDLDADHITWSDELFKIFDVKKESFDPSFQGYLNRLNNESRSLIEGIIERAKKTGDDFSFENKVNTSEGTKFILSRGRVVRDKSQKAVKMLGTSQDITERKRVEIELREARDQMEQRVEMRTLELQQSLERERLAKEQAESANQAKMQFLANMSHEIRTPMNSILGFSDLLFEGDCSESESKEYLERIRTNGRQLLLLIDDILDLSKFEAGKIPVHEKWFSLRDLIRDVSSSFQILIEEKGLDFKVFFQDDLPDQIYTDDKRLRQVLVNLIGNSVKFSDQGFVRVSVSKKSDHLSVDVEDSGPGIAFSQQSKLFQVFSQGDESVSRKFGGSGLGLALSKKITLTLGGDLVLKSSSPGVGSHFHFFVPMKWRGVEHNKDQFDYSQLASFDLNRLVGRRVLLAEDSSDNVFLITHYLKSLGVDLDVASDGLEALNLANQKVYDWILMDVQMPHMDGLAATKKLRAKGYQKPILALTAHALESEVQRSMEAGCDLHLTKPIEKERLLEALISTIL